VAELAVDGRDVGGGLTHVVTERAKVADGAETISNAERAEHAEDVLEKGRCQKVRLARLSEAPHAGEYRWSLPRVDNTCPTTRSHLGR
jgi:hypothetical protein